MPKKALLIVLSTLLALSLPGLVAACSDDDGGDTGGVLSVATEPGANRDPAVASARSDILINQQVYEWLVDVGTDGRLQPGLATSWDSPDGEVWTFTLRTGISFSNGEAFTAEDVVHTFERLRDPEIGSPLAGGSMANVSAIKALDDTQVEFTLAEANPEFPSDVTDYHAAILSKSVADPMSTWVGTGPFTLESYSAEDRAILKKNPDYWMKDEQGNSLPYVDELRFIFFPDLEGQVNALQGGQVQFVGGLTAELVDTFEADSALKVVTGPASAFHYVIHMRSDVQPAIDGRVRQALKLGTDHQGLIDQIRPNLAVVGNGTPVGPAYGDYYLDQAPIYDVERAKDLLAQTGASDLTITLYAQDALEVPAIATVWKEQMKAIGVTVDIQTIPPDVYYGEGDANWLEVEFGITEWGARATPNAYFNAAYVSDAPWNESHWSDEEFDTVVARINTEVDRTKRVELYKQAQQILIDRGPVIVPFFSTAAAGLSADLDGVELAADWSRTMFRTAQFTQ